MFSKIRLLATGLVLALFATAAQADYLDVTATANIRQSPSSSSAVLARPAIGTYLGLLDAGAEQNGYYHITEPTSQAAGWIYHTRVRLQSGDLPGSAPVTPPSSAANDVMTAHYINMGQGNATLLEFSCGAVLIDAGGENQSTTDGLKAYLTSFFARRTDLNNTLAGIIITHTHIDHNRALETVVENFTVQNYVYNGHLTGSGRAGANWMVNHANDNGRHVAIEAVSEDQVAAVSGGLSDAAIDPAQCRGTDPAIKILAGPYTANPGWSSVAFANENNSSLVVRVDFGQSSFLFPGDQEDDAIAAIVQHYASTNVLKSDVYEVGHHGSYNGTTAAQLAAIAPKIAVISMGDPAEHAQWTAWQYGHPRQSTVDLLAGAVTLTRTPIKQNAPVATAAKTFVNVDIDKAIYATGWDGTVDVTADPAEHYTVHTEH